MVFVTYSIVFGRVMKSDKMFLEQRLNKLMRYADELKEIRPEVVNSFSSWSALKLMVLMTTINMYTKIIKDKFNHFFFIDALAGSGVVKIKNEPMHIVGSPILAATIANEPFTHMYFIELDGDRAKALETRLDFLYTSTDLDLGEKNYDVLPCDANKAISSVIDEIEEKTSFTSCNYLAFIDNQRLDVNWKALRAFFRCWGDLLITFQTKGVGRVWGNAKDAKTPEEINRSVNPLQKFFGSDIWKQATRIEDLPRLYLKQIAEQGKKSIQEKITIKGREESPFYYEMLYCTRETSHGSPYIEIPSYMKERIENFTGDSVKKVLQIMSGKQTSLNYFYQKEKQGKKDHKLDKYV